MDNDSLKVNKQKSVEEGFSVVTVTRRIWQIDNVIANYERQTFPSKELIIVINNDSFNSQDIARRYAGRKDIYVTRLTEKSSLGECLNYGYSMAGYNYIAKFDDDDYYGSAYLEESYRAFKEKECDLVCKASIFYYLQEYQELIIIPRILKSVSLVFHGSGATICMTKEAFRQVQYSNLRKGVDLDLFNRCRKQGLNIYSTTSYNFLCMRYKNQAHTWNISARSLESKAGRDFGIKKISLDEAYKIVNHYSE